MSPDQATDLASSILAAIERNDAPTGSQSVADHCRASVASDLAGLRDHTADDGGLCYCCVRQDCPDADRYAVGLMRTAALYGVTP